MREPAMTEPIVFISRWSIRHGRRALVRETFDRAVTFIDSTKPRTALFAAYVDEDGSELRIVHAFPDATGMTAHFEGSEERSASIRDMIELLGIEVYGPAPLAAVDQLRRETAAVPGAELTLMPISVGGYLRSPA